MDQRPKVVIVGAGFGGLAAAKALGGSNTDVTIVDRTNHHLFQPLLYQVATAALSPSDIASATRTVLAPYRNTVVRLDEVVGVDADRREVRTASGVRLPYDFLVLATGCRYSFFGNDAWAEHAPVLKTLPDALRIRERLLSAFERAENSDDPREIEALLTFVVVGGGPTGVEMAGAMAELSRTAINRDFRRIAGATPRVILVEGGERLLSAFPTALSSYAQWALERLGVEVLLGRRTRSIEAHGLDVGGEWVDASTVVWAAGTVAGPAADWIGAEAARNHAIKVLEDCSVPGHPEIFAIGDAASFSGPDGSVLPGLAPVAKQQGRYVGGLIRSKVEGRSVRSPFRYRNWGSMAVIGRSHAVGDFGTFRVRGIVAWLAWSLVHLMLLVDFRSRLTVYVNWAWSWFTKSRGIRLLTGAEPGSGGAGTGPGAARNTDR